MLRKKLLRKPCVVCDFLRGMMRYCADGAAKPNKTIDFGFPMGAVVGKNLTALVENS
jgi:hypothetical protein